MAARLSSRSLEPNPARRAAVEVSCIPRKFGVPARPVSGVNLPTEKAVISGCLTTLRPNSCRHIAVFKPFFFFFFFLRRCRSLRPFDLGVLALSRLAAVAPSRPIYTRAASLLSPQNGYSGVCTPSPNRDTHWDCKFCKIYISSGSLTYTAGASSQCSNTHH